MHVRRFALSSATATINETITRTYLGQNRDTNHLQVIISYNDTEIIDQQKIFTHGTKEHDYYFDKMTGMIFEYKYEETHTSPQTAPIDQPL